MTPIDIKREFISINIAVLTISDSRTLDNDSSGDLLRKKITNLGHKIIKSRIINDEISLIKKTILDWSIDKQVDAIITTGGTGLTGRDSTPEAIQEIADKVPFTFIKKE